MLPVVFVEDVLISSGGKILGPLIRKKMKNLWTLYKALGPETAAAGGVAVSKTVFQVRLSHIAAIAEGAGREIKSLQIFAQLNVLRIIP